MAAKNNKISVTPEMVQAVLSSMSVQDLEKSANDKKMEAVKDDIDLYLKTDGEQIERLGRIRLVDSEWRPPTWADRVVSFLSDKDEPQSKADISTGTGIVQLWSTLKKLEEGGKITQDKKTEKYSVVETKVE